MWSRFLLEKNILRPDITSKKQHESIQVFKRILQTLIEKKMMLFANRGCSKCHHISNLKTLDDPPFPWTPIYKRYQQPRKEGKERQVPGDLEGEILRLGLSLTKIEKLTNLM